MSKLVAIIPARGGSKSVPRKNIAPAGGRPLIAWTIEAANRTGLFERVLVSTDCPEIAAVARDNGADVPFLRPAELARDDSPGIAPIVHAVRWLGNRGESPEFVACLQPTSPLRLAEDIAACVETAHSRRAASVVSVTPASKHPRWMKRLDDSGQLHDLIPQQEVIVRRQDLPPAYALNGAIYLTRTEVILEQQTVFPMGTYGYVMPPERSLDVDTPWDLYLVDLILRNRQYECAN